MVYKSFRIQIILRIILIIINLWFLFFLIYETAYIVTNIILTILILLQIYGLVTYVEKTNKRLSQFLESIRYSDFSLNFSDKGKGSSFDQLNSAFNEVINEFKSTRKAKEEHFNYLQTVVQHITIGILVYRKDGEVDLFNNAIKRLFKVTNLRNIKDFNNIDKQIYECLQNIETGETQLLKVFTEDELLQLAVCATEFKMKSEEYMLVSMQNIHNELEEKEMESWQMLIRVLTHEIMNSITPISSLAGTVKELLIDEENNTLKMDNIDEETISSAQSALITIEKRSQGLLNFVNTYRNLTRIPKPNFRYFEISELFERIEQLLIVKIEATNIKFDHNVCPVKLKLTADPDLLEQVLINLVINSIDAVKKVENPMIKLYAYNLSNGKTIISVIDNGHGLKPDMLEKIFIPFFTSKKEGSGIGLSLSRQIMRMHKGSITVKSEPEKETIFSLIF